MGGFLQACRTVHGWLGVFVMPWVVVIGATGFYLNHSRMFAPVFGAQEFSEAALETLRPAAPITEDSARSLGTKLWPDQPIRKISQKRYHGRQSFFVKKSRGNIILSIATGHYYLKTRYTRRTYMPDGALLHTRIYWKSVLKSIHERGWIGRSLGSVLADAVALAMMVFGLTGLLMWSMPRVRRLRRRRQALPDTG